MGKSDIGGRIGGISDLQYPFIHRTRSPEQDGKSTPHRPGSTNPSEAFGIITKYIIIPKTSTINIVPAECLNFIFISIKSIS